MNRPIALVCYICGREFGTKSLAIHLKTCEKKWEQQESLKPPKQRRPCPQPPMGLSALLDKKEITKNDILNINSSAFETYVEEALMQCEYCGRKFKPESLKPHQKACAINPMIKKPYVSAHKKEEKPQEQKFHEQKQPQKMSEEPIKVPSKGYNLSNVEHVPQQNQNLQECYKCGRSFASDRVAKHEQVCKGDSVKVQEKKVVVPPPKPKGNLKKVQKDPKWKVQHEQFQQAMQYNRKMRKMEQSGGKISDLPPPPKGNYDHYTECQYCGRKYAPEVAERHIPKCANIINKPGGIKPSQIQQKYVGGTGVSSGNFNKPKPSMTGGIQKPMISSVTQSSAKTSSYVKPPSPMKPAVSQTTNQQYGRMFKK